MAPSISDAYRVAALGAAASDALFDNARRDWGKSPTIFAGEWRFFGVGSSTNKKAAD
jgi:hypothetical protein